MATPMTDAAGSKATAAETPAPTTWNAETLNEFYENIWEERFADVLDYKSIF